MADRSKQVVILAVDDTPENLDVVKGALAGDYVIKAAINGMIALKIAQKVTPELILLDIRMPGMDGFEVMSQLQTNQEACARYGRRGLRDQAYRWRYLAAGGRYRAAGKGRLK
jgi:CheY-like chemotaxis protein